MRTAMDILVAAVKMGLMAAGVLFVVEVLVDYLRLGERQRPELDPSNRIRSTWKLSVWATVVAIELAVRLSRPMLNMLSEASADVGEWAMTRRHAHLATRGH